MNNNNNNGDANGRAANVDGDNDFQVRREYSNFSYSLIFYCDRYRNTYCKSHQGHAT